MILYSLTVANRVYEVVQVESSEDQYRMYSGIPPEMRGMISKSGIRLTLRYTEYIPRSPIIYQYTLNDIHGIIEETMQEHAKKLYQEAKEHARDYCHYL